MPKAKIMVVEDDPALRNVLEEILTQRGDEVEAFGNAEDALERVDDSFDVVLSDIRLPGMDGIELLRRLRERSDRLDVLMMTSYSSVESAVEAMRIGAADYITKPLEPETLLLRIDRLLERRCLAGEVSRLRRELEERYDFGNLLGRNPKMLEMCELIVAVADTDANVLIQGETGTGKELVAKAVHYNSARKGRPFVKVDCAALTETLLESELFGHVRGSFTGATRDREGRFRTADGGTIFLDEIGNVPQSLQVKLLRVLQDSEFEPVGGDRPVRVDVRVLAATNADLSKAVQEGTFRRDLFYRINVVTVRVPPLRERRDDVPLLACHFLVKYCEKNRRSIRSFTQAALNKLRAYEWPGNVRELENAVERAVILCKRDRIGSDDLLLGDEIPAESDDGAPRTLKEALGAAEKVILFDALQRTDWDKERAADELGISRASLYSKIKKLNIRQPT